MSARTYALARADQPAQLVTVEAEITEGLPATVLDGLPDTYLRETRDRIQAAIINSGKQWPAAEITVSVSSAQPLKPRSALDLSIAVAILAAAGDIPCVALADKLFLAELGLDGQLRPAAGISALLAVVTRNELPAIADDGGFVLVVAKQDELAARQAIAQSAVPFVRVAGAHRIGDVAAWMCGKARLGLMLPEGQTE
jgi:magnesium chelatase family protein